jgi:hypothetical protein
MCVLALLLEPGRSLVAANRDEAFDRPSGPPMEVEPGVVAGVDLLRGGTWLGANKHGLLIAVTNRKAPAVEATSYSRGLLARETLRCRQFACLRGVVERRLDEHPIAGFNLVAVLDGRAICLMWDGALRVVELGPGAHVVSSDRDVDAPGLDERRVFDAFLAAGPATPERLREFLASHEGERPVCKHGERFGTVSSTIVEEVEGRRRLWHAQGPPCRTPHVLIK